MKRTMKRTKKRIIIPDAFTLFASLLCLVPGLLSLALSAYLFARTGLSSATLAALIPGVILTLSVSGNLCRTARVSSRTYLMMVNAASWSLLASLIALLIALSLEGATVWRIIAYTASAGLLAVSYLAAARADRMLAALQK